MVVIELHRRIQELLGHIVVKHSDLLNRPIAWVGVEFILAFPNLLLLIEHPNALILEVGGDAVRILKDRLVSLQVQLHLTLYGQRVVTHHQKKASREKDHIRARVRDSLNENRLQLSILLIFIIWVQLIIFDHDALVFAFNLGGLRVLICVLILITKYRGVDDRSKPDFLFE